MKLRPSRDNVIVKPDQQKGEQLTEGGLVIPEAMAEKPQTGIVVACGPWCDEPKVVGSRVLFGKYTGSEFTEDGEDFLVMKEEQIIGAYVD